MRRRPLTIVTHFSESDAEDIKEVLDFHPEESSEDFLPNEIVNFLSQLISCFAKIRNDRLINSFERIKKAA